MHQQVRMSTKKTGSGSPGPGAKWDDEGSLEDILTILRDADVGLDLNLQAAGGRDLDEGGEFVFSVHHGEKDDDHYAEAAVKLLEDEGYAPRIVPVHTCVVTDQRGNLLACIQDAQERQGPVYEIFVGTQGDYDGIPIQVTSREVVERKTAR
jgi:hypothetical protein